MGQDGVLKKKPNFTHLENEYFFGGHPLHKITKCTGHQTEAHLIDKVFSA